MKTQVVTDKTLLNRIETGPLKINDDWTGAFIRGDNAFYIAMGLKGILNGLGDKLHPLMEKPVLEGIIEILKSSDESKKQDE